MLRGLLVVITCLFLCNCAAGAATSGYALKASTCEGLTPSGTEKVSDIAEEKVINKLHSDGWLHKH